MVQRMKLLKFSKGFKRDEHMTGGGGVRCVLGLFRTILVSVRRRVLGGSQG